MNLFESTFMRKARYMTEDKRALLLDTMEQTRQEINRLKPTYRNSGYEGRKLLENKWEMIFETALVTAWMLVEQPKERTAQQVQMRVKEMKKLTTDYGCADMFAAVTMCIVEKSITPGVTVEDGKTFSGEYMSDNKKYEYKDCFEDYFDLSDADRERFIAEVTHPYSQHKTYNPIKVGRQRED